MWLFLCILQISADAVDTPPTIELPLSEVTSVQQGTSRISVSDNNNDTIDDPSVLSVALTNLNGIGSWLSDSCKSRRESFTAV